jgi:uncharacterized membrane protein YidH (DUF202 family)
VSAVVLENLRKDAEMRPQTDRQVATAWLLLPIISIVVAGAAVAVVFGQILSQVSKITPGTTPVIDYGPIIASISFIIGVGVIVEVLTLYFFYMLIRRRNQHFPRQQRYFSDLVTLLRGAGSRRGVNIDAMLVSMENTIRQAQAEETEKSAILWVVLMLIPYVNIIAYLYIYYFLTSDFYKHERWEDGMLSDVERALSALGVTFAFRRNESIPSRNFVLYLVITIVTVGVFGLYWEYTLIKDPNNHFANHAVYEPQLVQLVTPLAA